MPGMGNGPDNRNIFEMFQNSIDQGCQYRVVLSFHIIVINNDTGTFDFNGYKPYHHVSFHSDKP
ncbi:hypothetical protein F090043F1_12490 [Parabacteroides goldsteinii]